MSRRGLAVAVLVVLPSLGCIEETPSLHPLFAASEAVPGLEGEWISLDGDEKLRFEAAKDGYRVPLVGVKMTVDGKDEPFDLQSRMVIGRLAGQLFADFTPVDGQDSTLDGYAGLALWPVHVFARVQLSPGRLEIARLDEEWLHQAIRSGQIHLDHEVVGEDIVLTASSEDLQRFLTDWGFHEDLFKAPTVFVRRR